MEEPKMTKLNLVICDHCDVRDKFDSTHVPKNDILPLTVAIVIEGIAGHSKAPPDINADLCSNCRKLLHNLVMQLMSKQPIEQKLVVEDRIVDD
jgi:hypothetical protein